jgi:thiol-disulfide isomerase/thioredoxin/Tfp pilus assembly protein PilF
MRAARNVSLVLVVLGSAIPALAQTGSSAEVDRLRSLFYSREFETGYIEAQKLTATPSPELKAWTILLTARNSREDEAVEQAREMAKAAPDDKWSHFALAGALYYKGTHAEAADVAAKALAADPDRPEFIYLRAQALVVQSAKRDEGIAFIDANLSKLKNPAEVMGLKAYALYTQSLTAPGDQAKRNAAFALYEEARKVDPKSVNAHYNPAVYLDQQKRADEAVALLETALTLAPGAASVHQAYWNALRSATKLTGEQKREKTLADMDAFFEKYGDRPAALLAVANSARTLKEMDRAKRAEDKILASFDDTVQADWVYSNRWREYSHSDNGTKNPELRRILQIYVGRPQHRHEGLLGEAYRNLFFLLVEDPAVRPDELVAIANGMVKYEKNNPHLTVVRAPIVMADKKVALTDAERIARDGLKVLRARIEENKEFYKTGGEFDRAVSNYEAMGRDAIGWVLFAQGKIDEAEKELIKSYELDHDSRDNLHHLGRLYEAKNDPAKAEEFYVKGMAVQSPGTNPSQDALKALYVKRNGNAEGFDAYLAKVHEADRERRRSKIASERVADAQAAPAFNLRAMDGRKVSLESLKGKVVVINFWGIWCGWCVQEMPDLQKLHEKYVNDPDVAVITIDNDDNPDDVPPWMKTKGYTFPVLFDDGYVSKSAGITAFPTTWFLDKDGRKAYVKVGWSEKLLEEFSWRIESLRTGTAVSR